MTGFVEADQEAQTRIQIFRQRLADLGWVEGRNFSIDVPVQFATKFELLINGRPPRRSGSTCRSNSGSSPTKSSNNLNGGDPGGLTGAVSDKI